MDCAESLGIMKRNFTGKGTMAGFVDSSNRIFAALSNMEVKVPPGFSGAVPEMKLRESDGSASLELNMNGAIMLNEKAASVTINGVPEPNFSLSVSGGKLTITVV